RLRGRDGEPSVASFRMLTVARDGAHQSRTRGAYWLPNARMPAARSSPPHGRSAERAGDVNDLADDFGPVARDRVVGGIFRQQPDVPVDLLVRFQRRVTLRRGLRGGI